MVITVELKRYRSQTESTFQIAKIRIELIVKIQKALAEIKANVI